MLRTDPHVIPSRIVDAKKLGWLSGKRAATRQNFPANFQYFDLRGFSLADLDRALSEESDAYKMLEETKYSQEAIDDVDRMRAMSHLAPMVDFGVATAVVALSALGCVPVTSCRGPTLGLRPHSQPAPMIVFYARKVHLSALLGAVAEADCQIVNNTAKIEIYADDLVKMRLFALALRALLAGGSVNVGS
jgi:hypothetical protein